MMLTNKLSSSWAVVRLTTKHRDGDTADMSCVWHSKAALAFCINHSVSHKSSLMASQQKMK